MKKDSISTRLKDVLVQLEGVFKTKRMTQAIKANEQFIFDVSHTYRINEHTVFTAFFSIFDRNTGQNKPLEQQQSMFRLTANGRHQDSCSFDLTQTKAVLKAFRDSLNSVGSVEVALTSAFDEHIINAVPNFDYSSVVEYQQEIGKDIMDVTVAKTDYYDSCEALNTAREQFLKELAESKEAKKIEELERELAAARTEYSHKECQLSKKHDLQGCRERYSVAKTSWSKISKTFTEKSLKCLSKLKLPLSFHSTFLSTLTIDEQKTQIK